MVQQGPCPPLDGSVLANALVRLCQSTSEDSKSASDPVPRGHLVVWENTGVVNLDPVDDYTQMVAASCWPGGAYRPPGTGVYFVTYSTAVLDGEDTEETLQVVPDWAPEADAYLEARDWRLQPAPQATEDGDARVWLPPKSTCETCPHLLTCALGN
jgi:hypothetical protein